MDEAKLCDRIALMQAGKIMSIDKPETIIANFPKPLFALKATNIYKLLKDFRSESAIETCFAFGDNLHITLVEATSDEQTINAIAKNYDPEGFDVKKIRPTIEDSFIRLMKEQNLSTEFKQITDGR
jgi:ABC-type multidrug transport system ATPase subunit